MRFKRYARNGKPGFWSCARYPACDGAVGAHPDGSPLGFPVPKDIRELRIAAHAMLDKLWGYDRAMPHGRRRANIRRRMYAWLKANTRTGHVSQLERDELIELIAKLAKMETTPPHMTLSQMAEMVRCPNGRDGIDGGEREFFIADKRAILEDDCGRHDVTDQLPEGIRETLY
jgi:hypothetical protein